MFIGHSKQGFFSSRISNPGVKKAPDPGVN
jgi:hypothetical protein